MLQPAEGDLEDWVTMALTCTHICTHVNMDLPEHGPLICPTAKNLQTGGAWGGSRSRNAPLQAPPTW